MGDVLNQHNKKNLQLVATKMNLNARYDTTQIGQIPMFFQAIKIF